MFPYHLHIEVFDQIAQIWEPYWDSHLEGVTRSRIHSDWRIASRYYGRSTRNHAVGVCFHSSTSSSTSSSLSIGNSLTFLHPVSEVKRFRFHFDDMPLGEIEVPLRPEWLQSVGMSETLSLPVPIPVGGRLEVMALEMRDVRSTDEWECSGLYFRLL